MNGEVDSDFCCFNCAGSETQFFQSGATIQSPGPLTEARPRKICGSPSASGAEGPAACVKQNRLKTAHNTAYKKQLTHAKNKNNNWHGAQLML